MTIPVTIAAVHEPSARSDAAYATAVDLSSVASGAHLPREWRPAPGELVSLWDMLCFPAQAFVSMMQFLTQMETSLQVSRQWLAVQSDASVFPGAQGLRAELARQGVQGDDIDAIKGILQGEWEKLRETLVQILGEIEKACLALQLDSGLAKVGRMRQELERAKSWPDGPAFLQGHLKDLRERIEDQLKSRLFAFIPPEKAKHFLQAKPFGEKVHDKFPGAAGDIVDAGWCLGIDRASAAVYHLMCVMELGVRRLAKRLKLPKHLEHKPWGEILGAARAAIATMPYGSTKERGRRDRYSEVVAHLNSVKDAWRNPTMHSKRRYTPEEAEAIYGNVKTFMIHLADKVF